MSCCCQQRDTCSRGFHTKQLVAQRRRWVESRQGGPTRDSCLQDSRIAKVVRRATRATRVCSPASRLSGVSRATAHSPYVHWGPYGAMSQMGRLTLG